MSYALTQQVIARSQSRGLERLVLITIADIAGHDGRGRINASALARRAGIDIDDLPNIMYELGKLGELRYEPEGSFVITLPGVEQ